MEDSLGNKDWTFVDLVKQIYLTWDGPAGNEDKGHLLRNYLSVMLTATIFVAFLVDFAQSVPSQRVRPTTCANPACNNVADICPGTMICEPTTAPTYLLIGAICNYIFTIEYGIRFFSLWAVDSRDAEIVPSKWPFKKPDPVYPLWEHYARWIILFRNLVDLATILPFYVIKGKATQFVRVFRLLRIFKLLRQFVDARRMLNLIVNTIRVSLPALRVLIGILLMAVIFFGSIMYQVESGTFVVNAEYPNGVYLRRTINGAGLEVSPFHSIPDAFYYAVTTVTTVGYGDLVATSWIGRAIASTLMFFSLVMISLPISVIGSNFSDLYKEAIAVGWNEVGGALKIDDMDEVGMIALFHEIDTDGYGYIDEEKLYETLCAAGFSMSRSWLRLMVSIGDGNGDGRITCDDFIELCFKIQGSSRVRTLLQENDNSETAREGDNAEEDPADASDKPNRQNHRHKIVSVQKQRSIRGTALKLDTDNASNLPKVEEAKAANHIEVGCDQTLYSAESLPLCRVPSSLLRHGSSKSSLVSAGDPTCVLVVDDTSSTRKIICRLLGSVWTNLVILEAADGARAVEIVREAGESIDYVFMDNSMPIMNGPEATRMLREELGYERIIVGMTDHGLGSVKLFKTSGASEVLRKPVTKAALQALKLQISKKLSRNASDDDLAHTNEKMALKVSWNSVATAELRGSASEEEVSAGGHASEVGPGNEKDSSVIALQQRLAAQHKRVLKMLDANRLARAQLDAMHLKMLNENSLAFGELEGMRAELEDLMQQPSTRA